MRTAHHFFWGGGRRFSSPVSWILRTHAPLTPDVHASSEEHSSGKGVSIEALQLLSQLDEQKLIWALESEDIRLGCGSSHNPTTTACTPL